MRALLSVMVLVAGCGMTESEQAEANYNDLAGKVTESCGTFSTTVPSIRCMGPANDVTPIATCLTTHLADLVPARADGSTGVTGGNFDMGRIIYRSETFLFVVDGGVTIFHHDPEYTSYSDFGEPTTYEETWSEAHCTGVSTTDGTSNCPSVVGTDCDYPPI
jgi:hypothetical protein